MKLFMALMISILSIPAFALDPFNFTCDQNGVITTVIPGVKKAPISPVVGLNIKVINTTVPLFVIKVKNNSGVEKTLFTTDWAPPTVLSKEGQDLLTLLSFFYSDVSLADLAQLRAALPTDLLDGFAYLELKNNAGQIKKIAFQGSNPTECI